MSPSATRSSTTSRTPSSTSATSSSATACTTAPAARSRRCSRQTSATPCATRPPIAWRGSTFRRASPTTPSRRSRRSTARSRRRSATTSSSCARTSIWRSAGREALLALPYAYSKLGVHGRAAVLYRNAAQSFEGELHKLDASLASIRDGEFLKDLVREEIRQDKDWVVRLRRLPDAPETFYLTSLIASHEFQSGLQNYLDLEDMRKKLVAWQRSLDAFDDIIQRRRAYYSPLLPGIDSQFRKLDSQIRLRVEQRDHLNQLVQHMLIAPRPDYLATSDELQASARIARLESALHKAGDGERADASLRLARVKAAVTWNLETP